MCHFVLKFNFGYLKALAQDSVLKFNFGYLKADAAVLLTANFEPSHSKAMRAY